MDRNSDIGHFLVVGSFDVINWLRWSRGSGWSWGGESCMGMGLRDGWWGLPIGDSESWRSGSVGVGVVEFSSDEAAMWVNGWTLFWDIWNRGWGYFGLRGKRWQRTILDFRPLYETPLQYLGPYLSGNQTNKIQGMLIQKTLVWYVFVLWEEPKNHNRKREKKDKDRKSVV